MVFKKIALGYNLSCVTEEDYISFDKNMILLFRRKMKDDLSQKSTWKHDIFFKCSKKIIFSKKLRWNMIFLILSGNTFFFPKTWYFLFGRKMKDDISQEIHGNMIFYEQDIMPLLSFAKKFKNDLLRQKCT